MTADQLKPGDVIVAPSAIFPSGERRIVVESLYQGKLNVVRENGSKHTLPLFNSDAGHGGESMERWLGKPGLTIERDGIQIHPDPVERGASS